MLAPSSGQRGWRRARGWFLAAGGGVSHGRCLAMVAAFALIQNWGFGKLSMRVRPYCWIGDLGSQIGPLLGPWANLNKKRLSSHYLVASSSSILNACGSLSLGASGLLAAERPLHGSQVAKAKEEEGVRGSWTTPLVAGAAAPPRR